MDIQQEIIKLKIQGLTYKKIGEIFGFSKQRAHALATGYRNREPKPITKIPDKWKPGPMIDTQFCLDGRNFLAEKVRERDNHTCQICGKKWSTGQRRLDVHHLDAENENDRSYENYKKFDRMITLCHRCHIRLDSIRKKFTKKCNKN